MAGRSDELGSGPLGAALTVKERQVILLLTSGSCNKDIAARLGLSVRTIEFHISNMLRKLRVSNRLELALHYARMARHDMDPGME
jgi:DNA-binding NarL/FixJ family response regulator